MNEVIRAGELTRKHLGRQVTLRCIDGSCTGQLAGVEHIADIVSVGTIMEPDATALARARTKVTIKNWGARQVDPTDTVELLN